jgi:hypothetical protein
LIGRDRHFGGGLFAGRGSSVRSGRHCAHVR